MRAAFMINFSLSYQWKEIALYHSYVKQKERAHKNCVLTFNLSNSRNGKDGKLQKFRQSHCFSNFTLYFYLLWCSIQKSGLRLYRVVSIIT